MVCYNGNMEDLSEQAIRTNCPHCDPTSQAFTYLLEETENFSIVCDAHPLEEGHILIIPKQHISCIAEYSEEVYKEFLQLYKKCSDFVKKTYGSISTFEHGKFGQTVFHSHVHLMPFTGSTIDIIPEGKEKLTKIDNLEELRTYFKRDGGYLFFSIEDSMWIVDLSLAVPRFFRDRFALALHKPERGNWKTMRANEKLMEQGQKDDLATQAKWNRYNHE